MISLKQIPATVGAWTIQFLSAVAFKIQDTRSDRFSRWVGRIYADFANKQRIAMERNLRLLPNIHATNIPTHVEKIFENFCITLYDFFHPANLTIDVPDRDKLEKLRRQNKGVLMLTFHMGHWELGARTMREWGWPVTAVYQEYTNHAFRNMIQRKRAPGVQFIPVGTKAAKGVLNALRHGHIVAMLGDHPFGEKGIPVELFGRHVLWPKGPILLAVRENVPIVIAVVVRVGHRTYRAHIEDPLIPQNHSRAEVERLVQEVAHKFGKFVQQYPEQWYRFREFEFVE